MKLGIPIYEGVNLLDVPGPLEMFYWTRVEGKKDLQTVILSQNGKGVTSHNGVAFQAQASFVETPTLDVLWVPGAGSDVIGAMMKDAESSYLHYLRQVADKAKWVCSVCEGALLLARAGLLNGHKATTHWAVVPCLERFTEIDVDTTNPRFVRSGNRLTGGGISSGLDEALELIWLLFDEETAKTVQQVTQYYPKPPVWGSIPKPDPCEIDWT